MFFRVISIVEFAVSASLTGVLFVLGLSLKFKLIFYCGFRFLLLLFLARSLIPEGEIGETCF